MRQINIERVYLILFGVFLFVAGMLYGFMDCSSGWR